MTTCDRHPKWRKVKPGDTIPEGQPYRVEYPKRNSPDAETAREYEGSVGDFTVTVFVHEPIEWFVDSSWKPPLVLPTELSLILAEVDDRFTEDKVLLTGPHTDKGNTWWSFDTRLSLIPDEINSFEVLWTESQ